MDEREMRARELIQAHKNGELGFDDFKEQMRELGIGVFDPRSDPDPRWADNNASRVGFTYNPYHHPRGKYYQDVIKIGMIKALDLMYALGGGGSRVKAWAIDRAFGLSTWAVHKLQREEYHSDIYKFEDPRLQFIRRELQDVIVSEFSHQRRKCQFMLKALDIVLSLMKEDIYYRPRFLKVMERIGIAYSIRPDMFAIDDTEAQYRDKWNITENEDDFRRTFGLSDRTDRA